MASSEAKERKILVAVDEGEESSYALSWCLKNIVAENSKDTLILLYSKQPPTLYPAMDRPDLMASVEKYNSEVAESVMEKAKSLCKEVKVETKVERGDPRDVICQMTEKLAVNMVVMGSHGYGLRLQLSKLLLNTSDESDQESSDEINELDYSTSSESGYSPTEDCTGKCCSSHQDALKVFANLNGLSLNVLSRSQQEILELVDKVQDPEIRRKIIELSLNSAISEVESLEKPPNITSEAKGRKILVAVDEGEESSYALSWCLKNIVAENSKDTLILLYSKHPPTLYPPMVGMEIMASVEKYSSEVAESVMEKAKSLCKEVHDVKVETKVERGDPRDVICQMTEKLAVDMVVMGSHGYGMIKRAFLGSVSNYCVQNVKCPVLIVKRPKSTTPNP
ncbi:hypothetical protein Vadar_004141 [Vaccinium darrowii]|uniref:Uncharacterized protein n=1 Tax=Vaccinium darrowii TaxID=229202 RepID=A0ACB7ZGU5_9ERIC|nr:hypothetical protein Vadar_004141 [Vaccinium darrowii]